MTHNCIRAMILTGAAYLVAIAAVVDVDSVSAQPSRAGPLTSSTTLVQRLDRLAAQFESGTLTTRANVFGMNSPAAIQRYRLRLQDGGDTIGLLDVRFQLARELLWAGQTADALHEFDLLDAMLTELVRTKGNEAAQRRRIKLPPWRAIAHLRSAEDKNCVAHHNPESCLFPLRGRGIHSDRSDASAAIELLTSILKEDGRDLMSRWLLNLAHMTLGSYPSGVPEAWLIRESVFESDYDIQRFRDVAIATGTDVVGLAGGSIVEDFDGDGFLDIVASSWGVRDQLRFLRSDGNGGFEDRTARAGLTGEIGGLNITHADYDNDGFPDILVLRGGWLGSAGIFPNSLLRNNGDGTFENVTKEAGLLDAHPGQTAAWADYDNDGLLDVFVGNETTPSGGSHPCRLFHNNGDGTFSDVASDVGLAHLGWVKGAAWGDYDNDDKPDLYISRIMQPNLLFKNEGVRSEVVGRPWGFRDVSEEAGVTEPPFSFPTWFWDYDNDGWLDLFVAGWDDSTIGDVAAQYLGLSVSREHPRLYQNQRDGTFKDVTKRVRLDRVLLTMGANFGDLDNDGFLDLYLGTGAPNLATLMPNRMFRNAAGRFFQDVTTSGGFGHLQKGHGVSFGDLDNDGDQDIYTVMGGWYSGDRFQNVLFENPGHGNNWITLRFHGVFSNRMGVGARVHIVAETDTGIRHIHRVVGTGGSFGSSSLQLEVGLGKARSIRTLEVRWPASGKTQIFRRVPINRVIEINEDANDFVTVSVRRIKLGAD